MTQRSFRVGALLCAAAVSVLAMACGSSNSSTSSGGGGGGNESFTVGLITKTDTNPFFVKMKQGAKKAAAQNNVKLEPQSAADALFATNNYTAGKLIGEYAKKAMAGKKPVIAMMDLNPGITVGVLRHNGFLDGFGIPRNSPDIVCTQFTQGDLAKGQAAMQNCLQKNPNINLVYSINEPSGLGAYNAMQKAGKKALLVSVDGGCTGVKAVQAGKIAATSQQYPLKMASEGVNAIVGVVRKNEKVSGYHDTGVNLITAKPMSGVPSKSVQFGLANCWG